MSDEMLLSCPQCLRASHLRLVEAAVEFVTPIYATKSGWERRNDGWDDTRSGEEECMLVGVFCQKCGWQGSERSWDDTIKNLVELEGSDE